MPYHVALLSVCALDWERGGMFVCVYGGGGVICHSETHMVRQFEEDPHSQSTGIYVFLAKYRGRCQNSPQ